ncbi:MAG: aspartate carbamoyltransferase [Spirochaetaceae bacterium]|jgi:aspartate carbamoyltransferase catalytic subunit|nr:aspartate carbamoyltransferase [Spirochaetaceae bacterium]
MLQGRSLIRPDDFSVDELDKLFELTSHIKDDKNYLRQSCRGKLLASLFFEPSTRTRLSFEAAMLRLGGSVLGFADAGSSSASKGESLADTIRVVSSYSDVIVMRSPKEGSALLASQYSSVPVVNAGDGGHHHPTQTLTDLVTIKRLRGDFSMLTIGFCGDLKFGRTVHSLATALSRYANVKMVFVSPGELKIPEYITCDTLKKNNIEYTETDRLEKVIGDLDVLYMTRVQRERFLNEEEYIRLKDSYILTAKLMKRARDNLIVLHPLPRVNEISVEVDNDPRAAYFKQAEYGMYIRMALLASIMGVV